MLKWLRRCVLLHYSYLKMSVKLDHIGKFRLAASLSELPAAIKLPAELVSIERSYEVSLESLILPHYLYNLRSPQRIEFRLDEDKVTRTVYSGNYTTTEAFVSAINQQIGSPNIRVHFDSHRRLSAVVIKEARCSLKLSAELADILNLPTGTMKGAGVTWGMGPVTFPHSENTYVVLCDIVEKQIHNNMFLPYIAFIDTKGSGGEQVRNIGKFYPVNKTRINDMMIDIVHCNGESKKSLHLSGQDAHIVLSFRPVT